MNTITDNTMTPHSSSQINDRLLGCMICLVNALMIQRCDHLKETYKESVAADGYTHFRVTFRTTTCGNKLDEMYLRFPHLRDVLAETTDQDALMKSNPEAPLTEDIKQTG